MKFLFTLLLYILLFACPQYINAQSLVANNDTAYLYTEYQPILIYPLANDIIGIEPNYFIQISISGNQQGLPILLCNDFLNAPSCPILYVPFEDFGVSDSMNYLIYLHNSLGDLIDSSNVATIYIYRAELPSDDCLNDCVYPGDVNRDGVVNSEDLLYIGIGYGTQGVARLPEEQGIDWQPHAANSWVNTIDNGLNFKHLDCNGDGIIDNADIEAIVLNYNMNHFMDITTTTNTINTDSLSTINLSLSIQNNAPIELGDTIIADLILGNPAELIDVYGFSFSIRHNAEDNGTGHIIFTPSFVNTDSNTLEIYKNQGSGNIEAALTRTNQITAQGNGTIARISFVMENFLEGKQLSDMLTLSVERFSILNNEGTWNNILINAPDVTASIEVISSTEQPQVAQSFTLSPMPANNYCYMQYPQKDVLQNVKIYDVRGMLQYQEIIKTPAPKVLTIPTENLPNGVYLVVIYTTKGITAKRLFVQH